MFHLRGIQILQYFRERTCLNGKNTQTILIVWIIKTLNFVNVIKLTVNDIFGVSILRRRKIIELIEEVASGVLILNMYW